MKVDKETARLWQECKKADEEMYKADEKLTIAIWFCMIAIFIMVVIHKLLN